MTEEQLKVNFQLVNQYQTLLVKESIKQPYHINLIDELRASENAHSRILTKLFLQKNTDIQYELFESFIQYIKQEGGKDFQKIDVVAPNITQEKKRLDVWIQDKDYTIIIENKVNWAPDQKHQIERYIDIAKEAHYKEAQIYVLYLPPTLDKEPDTQSWGCYHKKDIFKNRYLMLSYKDHILDWLKDKVMPNLKLKDNYLRSAIEQYIDHLEGLFNLRTIHQTMNNTMQNFLIENLKLGTQDIDQSIEVIDNKIEELDKITNQLRSIKDNYAYTKLEEWYKQLIKDFPNLEFCVVESLKDKYYPKFGVKLNYKENAFTILIEYIKADGGYIPYYGIGRHYCTDKKEEAINKFITSLNLDNYETQYDWWYLYKTTNFEDGYANLKALIEKVLALIEEDKAKKEVAEKN